MSEPQPLPTDPRFVNLTGRRFGKLQVAHYAGKSKKKYSLWHCLCDCGNTSDVVSTSLTKGLTKTCGRCPDDPAPAERACNKCGAILPFTTSHFYRHPAFRWGLRPQCKSCTRARVKRSGYKHRINRRLLILRHYSGGTVRCACCGEHRYEFLTIDHIGGGGRQHRKQLGSESFYGHLVKNNFPPGYRVLCFNCNWVIGHYGYCPHDRERQTTR